MRHQLTPANRRLGFCMQNLEFVEHELNSIHFHQLPTLSQKKLMIQKIHLMAQRDELMQEISTQATL